MLLPGKGDSDYFVCNDIRGTDCADHLWKRGVLCQSRCDDSTGAAVLRAVFYGVLYTFSFVQGVLFFERYNTAYEDRDWNGRTESDTVDYFIKIYGASGSGTGYCDCGFSGQRPSALCVPSDENITSSAKISKAGLPDWLFRSDGNGCLRPMAASGSDQQRFSFLCQRSLLGIWDLCRADAFVQERTGHGDHFCHADSLEKRQIEKGV